jgi:enoyl-CoA hydratase/carnithine racemase
MFSASAEAAALGLITRVVENAASPSDALDLAQILAVARSGVCCS